MAELTLDALTENTEKVTAFVEEQLASISCSRKTLAQINVAIDELFSNIANYAYQPAVGKATVRVSVQRSPPEVRISFLDSGIPYNPLEKEDPDTGLSAEERPIGGLGIYLVKKSMDHVRYEFRDGQNILTITKKLA